MWSLLDEARQNGWLVRVKRENIDPESLYGFVGALSSDFVALSIIDSNCRFDGARVFETEEVTFLEWDTTYLKNRSRVLEESPTSPLPLADLELASWESVIRSAAAIQPVMTFHRDRADSGSCYIGTNVQVESEYLRADEISFDGVVDGNFALRLSDITQIEFGDGYAQALWQMARNAKS